MLTKSRKIIVLLSVACVLVVCAILSLGAFQALSEQARNVQAYDVVHKLALKIRIFKMEKGIYPKSLQELQSADFQVDAEKRTLERLIEVTQHNEWYDIYNYKCLTNGFSIVVSNSKPVRVLWLAKPLKTQSYSEIDGKIYEFN